MPLVERDALIAELRAAAAEAAHGSGALVAVSGEAGAGKTSLVREALADAVWGYCEPLATPRPLGPFRDIAREILPGRVEDVAAFREELLDWLHETSTPLIIEDAHWIDDASADVLRFLGRRIGATLGLIVVTFRDELTPDHPLRQVLGELISSNGISRVEVPALSGEAVAELVADRPIDADEAYRLTNGNAFLVSQLLAAPGDPFGVPVQDAVAARLARLPQAGQEIVEFLSVIPGRVDAALLGDDWRNLDDAVTLGLLRVDDSVVEFRHELVRLAVEHGLAPGRRTELHAEVLRRLLAGGSAEPAVIAFHARAAHQVQVAFESELRAGRRAVVLGAHRQAAEHLRRAIQDSESLGETAGLSGLWLQLSREDAVIGHDAAATEAARRALELCPEGTDAIARADALRWLSRMTPSEADSHRLAVEAVQLLEPLGPSSGLAAAYALLATNRMLARDLGAVALWADRAIALAEETDDVDSRVVALQARGSARLLDGSDRTGADLRRAIELARTAGLDAELGRAYSNLISAAGESKLYALSAEAAEEGLPYFVARDLDGHASYARAWHARCLFEQGKWSAATVLVDEVLDGAIEASAIASLAAWTVQGRIRARRGDPHIGSSLAEAKRIADRSGALQRLAPVAAARAEAQWLDGNAGELPDGLRESYELAVDRANPWTIGELGLWMWRFGVVEGLPETAARPYRCHVNGDPVAAGAAWLEIGCPYEAADAWADSSDEDTVRAALGLFTDLGARPGRLRAARRLRELGVRSIPRGPRDSTAAAPDGLTTREFEVLGWLRAGLTDAEIAAKLQLSVKTVGHHVSAVLRKTGSRSRRDLRQR